MSILYSILSRAFQEPPEYMPGGTYSEMAVWSRWVVLVANSCWLVVTPWEITSRRCQTTRICKIERVFSKRVTTLQPYLRLRYANVLANSLKNGSLAFGCRQQLWELGQIIYSVSIFPTRNLSQIRGFGSVSYSQFLADRQTSPQLYLWNVCCRLSWHYFLSLMISDTNFLTLLLKAHCSVCFRSFSTPDFNWWLIYTENKWHTVTGDWLGDSVL